MGERALTDWDAVRRDYEEGRGTQAEIAARYGVLKSTLSMAKTRGGWVNGADIERWDKRDAAIDALLDTLTQRLKGHARTGARLAAAMKALEAAPLNAANLDMRADASAKAGRELSATVSMVATVQRMAERRRGASQSFTDQPKESPLERPEYLAVERAILDRLAAAGLVAAVERADAG